MSYVFSSARTCTQARAPHAAGRLVDGVRRAIGRLQERVAESLRHATARREFDNLDHATLRDLGMSRSEFDSYWAETHGLAEQTRTRVMRNLRDRYGV